MATTYKQLEKAYTALSNAHSSLLSCPVGGAWEANLIDTIFTRTGALHQLLQGKIRVTVSEDFLQMCRNLKMRAASTVVRRQHKREAHFGELAAEACRVVGSDVFTAPANI
jgi:hypothetical protein